MGKIHQDTRLSMSPAMLQWQIEVNPLVCSSPYVAVMYKAAFLIAFFRTLWIGKLVYVSRMDTTSHALHTENLSSLTIRVQFYKTDQAGAGQDILSTEPQTHLAHFALQDYLAIRLQGHPILFSTGVDAHSAISSSSPFLRWWCRP